MPNFEYKTRNLLIDLMFLVLAIYSVVMTVFFVRCLIEIIERYS